MQLFRLILAAANGLLFAFGLWWTIEVGVLRIRRWRMHLVKLLRLQELGEGTEADQAERERLINLLRKRISDYRNDPQTLLR